MTSLGLNVSGRFVITSSLYFYSRLELLVCVSLKFKFLFYPPWFGHKTNKTREAKRMSKVHIISPPSSIIYNWSHAFPHAPPSLMPLPMGNNLEPLHLVFPCFFW